MNSKNIFRVKIMCIVFLLVMMIGSIPIIYAATSDTIGMTITVDSALDITIADTSITPNIVADDTGTTDANHTIIVASNNTSGVHVTLEVEDTTSTVDRLCTDPDYSGTCDNTDYFVTDGTSSYINVDSAEYGGALSGTTVVYTDQNPLDTSTAAVTIMSTDATTIDGSGDDSTFQVTYDFYGDYTIVAQTYNGYLIFDIVSGT